MFVRTVFVTEDPAARRGGVPEVAYIQVGTEGSKTRASPP
jgi:hypothetical protein